MQSRTGELLKNLCRPLCMVFPEFLKKAPIRKIWSPQDPRPPPRVDEVTKNFSGYQPAIKSGDEDPKSSSKRVLVSIKWTHATRQQISKPVGSSG
ncbi:hypothetical protein Bca52824_018217 [Brassica carinata]|uniref:Uncharacterized protein n=1 Tax=Brassica carinata TaxID=52824 RepID=A0A8X7VPP8_BRACI|nr:hypothetical protein Bca52824_018217 [Brassica carinata]